MFTHCSIQSRSTNLISEIPHWIDGTRFLRLNSDFPLASAAFEPATNVAWANMKSEMHKAEGPLVSSLSLLGERGGGG